MLLTDLVLRGGRGPPVVEPLEQALLGFNDDRRQAKQIQADSPSSQCEGEISASSPATNVVGRQRHESSSPNGSDEGGASSVEVSTANAPSRRADYPERTTEAQSHSCKGGARDKSQRRGPREVYCDADKIVIVLPQRYIQTRTPAGTPPA